MYLHNIVVESSDENQETLQEIIEGIQFLCSTSTGKYPMNREFGIDQNLQDKPLSVVQPLLAIELKEKIERFEPRVEVSDVSFEYDADTGALTPIISIDIISLEEDEDKEDDEEDEDYEDEDIV